MKVANICLSLSLKNKNIMKILFIFLALSLSLTLQAQEVKESEYIFSYSSDRKEGENFSISLIKLGWEGDSTLVIFKNSEVIRDIKIFYDGKPVYKEDFIEVGKNTIFSLENTKGIENITINFLINGKEEKVKFYFPN